MYSFVTWFSNDSQSRQRTNQNSKQKYLANFWFARYVIGALVDIYIGDITRRREDMNFIFEW